MSARAFAHMSERFQDGPNAYAFRLAGYNSDLSYIQKMTKREHGVELPKHTISAYIQQHENDRRRAAEQMERRDRDRRKSANEGDDYDPRLLSFKRAQERKASLQASFKCDIPDPPKFKTYKRWQGGEVKIKIDEIRANKKAEKPGKKGFSAVLLIHAVAQAFYLHPTQVMGKSRSRVAVAARAVVAKILRERSTSIWSLSRIGHELGGRDHSTISNLLDTWEERCKQIPAMAEVYKMMGGVDAS